MGNIKSMAAPPARQEDSIELGGHAYGAVHAVTYSDGTPVPQAVRDSFADSDPFNVANPYYFSNVSTPAANPVPALDAYFSQVRAGVTRHFSRPFVGSPLIALAERAVDGPDHLMLTQADIIQL